MFFRIAEERGAVARVRLSHHRLRSPRAGIALSLSLSPRLANLLPETERDREREKGTTASRAVFALSLGERERDSETASDREREKKRRTHVYTKAHRVKKAFCERRALKKDTSLDLGRVCGQKVPYWCMCVCVCVPCRRRRRRLSGSFTRHVRAGRARELSAFYYSCTRTRVRVCTHVYK